MAHLAAAQTILVLEAFANGTDCTGTPVSTYALEATCDLVSAGAYESVSLTPYAEGNGDNSIAGFQYSFCQDALCGSAGGPCQSGSVKTGQCTPEIGSGSLAQQVRMYPKVTASGYSVTLQAYADSACSVPYSHTAAASFTLSTACPTHATLNATDGTPYYATGFPVYTSSPVSTGASDLAYLALCFGSISDGNCDPYTCYNGLVATNTSLCTPIQVLQTVADQYQTIYFAGTTSVPENGGGGNPSSTPEPAGSNSGTGKPTIPNTSKRKMAR